MGLSSMEEDDCGDCQHRSNEDGAWCYMFKEKPAVIPCAQHDQFENQRRISRFLKHPNI